MPFSSFAGHLFFIQVPTVARECLLIPKTTRPPRAGGGMPRSSTRHLLLQTMASSGRRSSNRRCHSPARIRRIRRRRRRRRRIRIRIRSHLDRVRPDPPADRGGNPCARARRARATSSVASARCPRLSPAAAAAHPRRPMRFPAANNGRRRRRRRRAFVGRGSNPSRRVPRAP